MVVEGFREKRIHMPELERTHCGEEVRLRGGKESDLYWVGSRSMVRLRGEENGSWLARKTKTAEATMMYR